MTETANRETANLPAVRAPEPEIATVDTDSWTQVVGEVAKLASYIAPTEFVPRALRDHPAAVAAAVLYGREVGLPPMTALNMTHVVEGKPGLSAEGMRSLVFAAGHEIEFTESTGAICTIRGRRRGSDRWSAPITWTLDMARAADLAGKNNWRKHPRQMLQARATTELCRLIFADVIHGFRSVEELEDMSDSDEQSSAAPAPAGTSRVGRRGARKAAAAMPPAAAALPPAPDAGVPLPGEPGYDTQTSGAGRPTGVVEAPPVEAPQPPAPEPDQTAEAEASDQTGGEHAAQRAAAAAPGKSGEEGEVPGEGSEPSSPRTRRPVKQQAKQRAAIMAEWSRVGVDTSDREERLHITSRIIGRDVDSTNALSFDEAASLISTLSDVKDRDQLMRLLDTIDQAAAEKAAAERGEDEQS